MREIKFRCYDRQDKKIYPVRDIHRDEESGRVYYKFTGSNLWLEDGVALDVMQFTGLKDMNGKEIYEGDIIKLSKGNIFVIKFFEGTFSLYNKLNDKYPFDVMINFQPVRDGDFEVIGNIYENPEFIKQKGE